MATLTLFQEIETCLPCLLLVLVVVVRSVRLSCCASMLSNFPLDEEKLTTTEERAMTEEIRKRAYKHCDLVVKPWVECLQQEKLAAPFRCKALQRRMEDCLHA